MATKQQRALVDQILRDISEVNPYTSRNKEQAFIWATGFLASYLASLSEEDPWVYKRLRRHISEHKSKPGYK